MNTLISVSFGIRIRTVIFWVDKSICVCLSDFWMNLNIIAIFSVPKVLIRDNTVYEYSKSLFHTAKVNANKDE